MIVSVCDAGDVNRAACAAETVLQRPAIAGFVVIEAFRPFDCVARANGERFLCGDGSSHLLLRIFRFTVASVALTLRFGGVLVNGYGCLNSPRNGRADPGGSRWKYTGDSRNSLFCLGGL